MAYNGFSYTKHKPKLCLRGLYFHVAKQIYIRVISNMFNSKLDVYLYEGGTLRATSYRLKNVLCQHQKAEKREVKM